MAARTFLAFAAMTLLLFAGISAAVTNGIAAPFDRLGVALAQAFPKPPWLAESARDLTSLGSNLVLGLVSLIAVSYAMSVGRRGMAACLLAAPAGCLLLVDAAKSLVDRARPESSVDGPLVFTSSFPSSHAALSVAVLAVGAACLVRLRPSRATASVVVTAAAGLSFLVGFSRVYLGLHWLSDVAAGWILGLCWASLCLAAFEWTRPANR